MIMLITPVARFVTRIQGEGDGLFVGSVMKDGRSWFEPNTIYQIEDVMGVLQITPIGKANGAESGQNIGDDNTLWHWAQDIGSIIERWGRHMFLTKKEYASILINQRLLGDDHDD
jgi:hypothetical protein